MSEDQQFTATGPTIIGFQTDGTNIDRGAEIAGNEFGIRGTGVGTGAVGIIGQAGQGNADGVQGYSSGSFSGVAGFGSSGADAGTGVFGLGGEASPLGGFFSRGAAGVRGIGGGGPNTAPPIRSVFTVKGAITARALLVRQGRAAPTAYGARVAGLFPVSRVSAGVMTAPVYTVREAERPDQG